MYIKIVKGHRVARGLLIVLKPLQNDEQLHRRLRAVGHFIEGSHYQLFVTKKIVYWPIAKSKG